MSLFHPLQEDSQDSVKQEEPDFDEDDWKEEPTLAAALDSYLLPTAPSSSSSNSSLFPRVKRAPRAGSTKNRSPYLRFFVECENKDKLRCTLCPTEVTEVRYMYGTRKVTSALRDHINDSHPTEMTKIASEDRRHEQAQMHLLRAIATGVLPFTAVDSLEVRAFLRCLDPTFAFADGQLFGPVLDAEFKTVHSTISSIVTGQEVAITVDNWGPLRGVTASVIDAQWNRHLVVLEMAPAGSDMPVPYRLAYGIKSITACISDIDNATISGEQEKLPKLGCVLRACALLVNNSLSAFTGGTSIVHRIRDVSKLTNCLIKEKIPRDVPTRWESVLRMLRVADAQMSVLHDTFRQAGVTPLTADEAVMLSKLVQFLGELEYFAVKMSTHQATLSSLIPYIKGIEETIAELHDGPLRFYHPQVLKQFTQQFAIYREHAVVRKSYLLDPRFLHLGMLDDARRTADLEEIFREADVEHGSAIIAEPQPKKSRSSLLAKAAPLATMKAPSHAKREYDLLFDLAQRSDLPEDSDPCVFWREQGEQFPRLAPLARRLLAIPPSSIHAQHFRMMLGDVKGVLARTELSSEQKRKLLMIGAYNSKEKLRFSNAEEYDAYYSTLESA